MKHKVKIFSTIYEDSLEDEINKWFEGQKEISILDIKYSTSQSDNGYGSMYYSYSALIYYMEVNL